MQAADFAAAQAQQLGEDFVRVFAEPRRAACGVVFHAADGSGYRFLAERLIELDQRNPITASRLAKVFSRWQSYGPQRRQRLLEALAVLDAAALSPNSREVVSQCLAAAPVGA